MRASGRSTLFTTSTTGSPASSALRSTKRVCGSGPSDASTSSITPSTMVRPRSTSPPKSAWPGVSTRFSFTSPYRTAAFLARIVMPRSRSWSIESMTRSVSASASWAENTPDWRSMASTRVVFPWSTWAMIATFRMSERAGTTPYAKDSAMRLSVLDQSPIAEGQTGAQALANTVDLARHAERLGYERYWLAEHHATPALACAAPEVLIAAVARATEQIRVGSGGVMLPHYSPLKVAEVFSTLAGLHPERIDLGIGRAPGTDPMTMLALQRDRNQRSPDDFPEQLAELLALLEDRMPPNHPFARHARTLPGLPERPEPWLLGSSPQSAIWAGELGLPYAIADFINPGGAALAADYRARFLDSER